MWTFPKSLNAAGYHTAIIGKWHLDKTIPDYADWWLLPGQGDYIDPVFNGKSGPEKHPGYVTDVTTDMALEWIGQQSAATPFFLAIHHKAPHRPWIPPARYAGWLDDVTIPEPATLFDDYANRASPASMQKMNISRDLTMGSDLKVGSDYAQNPLYAARNAEFAAMQPVGEDLTRWKYQQYLKDYMRCVKAIDDGVGRVMDALASAGLDQNTILIYSSDQGFFMGEHGWYDKRWIYEESLHMPFIIRWPGVVKPASRFSSFIQNIDYASTFMEMTGCEIPEGLHGCSIVPILRGETPTDWRNSVYYRYYDKNGAHNVANHYGVRSEQYTLAYYEETDEWELFDNEQDPHQLRNVYADPAYAEALANLKTELHRLREQYQDSD